MAAQFDPRRILRLTSNVLLRRYFESSITPLDVSWDGRKEWDIEPIFEAIHHLPPAQIATAYCTLRDLDQLDCDNGVTALAELVGQECPDRRDEFDNLNSRTDRALWVCMEIPKIFELALKLSWADTLSTGRYWIRRGLVTAPTLDVTEDLKQALHDALVTYYKQAQGRGDRCKVEYYRRAAGEDVFFVYLSDFPNRALALVNDRELSVQPHEGVFDHVFVYNAADATLELYAKGGKKVWLPLQQAFVRAVLGAELPAEDAVTPPYELNQLMRSTFTLSVDHSDNVRDARIHRLRLVPHARSTRRLVLEADPDAAPSDIHTMATSYLSQQYLAPEKVNVTLATISITHLDADDKEHSFSFNVSYPHACTLKSVPDENQRAIGERCLRLSGIDVTAPTPVPAAVP